MQIRGLGVANLTPAQIYSYAVGAGFTPAQAVTATAVAMAESGGNPAATAIVSNPAPGNLPETSYGLFQINTLGNPQYANADLTDPATNAAAAYAIFTAAGSSWNPWGAYTNGSYAQYLSAAQALDASSDSTADTLTADSTDLSLTDSTDSSSLDLSDIGGIDFTDPTTLAVTAVIGLAIAYFATR